jgi:hypothetical protein
MRIMATASPTQQGGVDVDDDDVSMGLLSCCCCWWFFDDDNDDDVDDIMPFMQRKVPFLQNLSVPENEIKYVVSDRIIVDFLLMSDDGLKQCQDTGNNKQRRERMDCNDVVFVVIVASSKK